MSTSGVASTAEVTVKLHQEQKRQGAQKVALIQAAEVPQPAPLPAHKKHITTA